MIAQRRGILLDIEGTTTPIRFVTDVLFPFARAHFVALLEGEGAADVLGSDVPGLRAEHDADDRAGLGPPIWDDVSPVARVRSAAGYALWLMDRDRKSTPLKSVQGRIWQEGYRDGHLRGEVFPDVPQALARWSRSGTDVRIFSSGSVLAQKLLFSTVVEGDLTRFLSGLYDTTTGAKTSPESYGRIADAYALPSGSILFASDGVAELDAARTAGMETLLCVRPGNPRQPAHSHRTADSFATL